MGQAQINVRTRACSGTFIARTKQVALTHNVRGKELKHRLLVMIRVVKLIEIGCWYSGQPRPLIANPLMPSEKQMTKVAIRQGCKIEAVSSVLLAWSQPGILLHTLFGQTSKGALVTSCHDQEKECCRTLCKRLSTEIK